MLKSGWIKKTIKGMSGSVSDLRPGQFIQITRGFGWFPVKWTQTKVIWKVDGMSAICTDGTLINCHDGGCGAIRPMAKFMENPQPTLKGRQVWQQIQDRMREQGLEVE